MKAKLGQRSGHFTRLLFGKCNEYPFAHDFSQIPESPVSAKEIENRVSRQSTVLATLLDADARQRLPLC
jgi:hypothetical protein